MSIGVAYITGTDGSKVPAAGFLRTVRLISFTTCGSTLSLGYLSVWIVAKLDINSAFWFRKWMLDSGVSDESFSLWLEDMTIDSKLRSVERAFSLTE